MWYTLYGFRPFWIIFHPSNLIFLLVLFISIILIISTNSWLITWIALEINIMVFLPLMLKKKNKYQSEAALKYFLTQVVASILILLCLAQLKINLFIFNVLLVCALILKIAAAPLHKWIPSLVGGLSWRVLFILLVVQKIAPFFLLSINFYGSKISYLVSFFIIMSAVIGGISALFQASIQKILAYSSISHLAWILSVMLINKFGWLLYFFIYALINFSILLTLSHLGFFYLSQFISSTPNTLKVWAACGFLSLAGLPPFSGFFPKLAAVEILARCGHKALLFFLIMSSLLTLFIYLRIILNCMYSRKRRVFCSTKSSKIYTVFFVNRRALVLGGAFYVILDFKLYLN